MLRSCLKTFLEGECCHHSSKYPPSGQGISILTEEEWGRADEILDLLSEDQVLSDENSSEDGPLEKAAKAGASLAAPKKAEIARERKVQSNPPPRPGQKQNSRGSKDPPRVCAWDRVKTYKREHFGVVGGKLRCIMLAMNLLARRKVPSKKHIKSKKHEIAKTKFQADRMKDQSIAKLLKANDHQNNSKVETLPEKMRVYRFKLVESCLTAGIPLSKVVLIRPFLEKYGYRITSRSHL